MPRSNRSRSVTRRTLLAGGAALALAPSRRAWAQAEGRRRRVYGLTDEGAAALAAQRTEWRRFARGVQAVLGKPALGAPVPGRPA